MTFVPRIMSTLATATEHDRGEAHGAWGHAGASSHAAAHEPGETPHAAAHVPANGGEGQEESRADGAQASHAPSVKAGEKRTPGPRPDGASSFAAELARNVMSPAAGDDHGSPEEGDLLEEQEAEEAPVLTEGQGGARASGAGDHHPVPPSAEEVPAGPHFIATSGVAAAVLPRAVVNGSPETPKSDAMPISPRVSTGSHVHADGLANSGEAARGAVAAFGASAHPLVASHGDGTAAPVAPSPAQGHAPEHAPVAAAVPAGPKTPGPLAVGQHAPAVGFALDPEREGRSPSAARPEEAPAGEGFHTPAPTTHAPSMPASSPAPHPSPAAAPSSPVATPAKFEAPAAPAQASSQPGARHHAAPPAKLPQAEPSPSPVAPAASAPAPHAVTPPVTVAPSSSPVPAVGQGAASPSPAPGAPASRSTPNMPSSRSAARAGAVYAQVATDRAPSRRSTGGVATPSPSAGAPHVVPGAPSFAAPASAQPSPSRTVPPAGKLPSDEFTAPPEAVVTSRHAAAAPAAPRVEPPTVPSAVAAPASPPIAARGPVAAAVPVAGHAPIAAHAPVAGAAPIAHAPGEVPTHVIASQPASTPAAKREAPADGPLAAAAVPPQGTPHRQPQPPSHREPPVPAPSSPVSPVSPVSDAAPKAPAPVVSAPHVSAPHTPRRDVAASPVQAAAQPAEVGVSAPTPIPAVKGSPPAAQAPEVGPRLSREVFAPAPASVAVSAPGAVSAPVPAGSGVTATGESTAAHPTPLVDSSPANPPLFRLSDTRRVQAAHLDLAQQSYQPGTVATSSPSAKGFDTGKKVDKGGKAKKARPVEFAPNVAPNAIPNLVAAAGVAPPVVAPKVPRAEEPAPSRTPVSAVRPGRTAQPDTIHELASAGPGAPFAIAAGSVSHAAPHAHGGVTSPHRRDGQAPFAGATVPAARDGASPTEQDAKRAEQASHSSAPAGETRPAHQQPAPVVAPDRAHPQAPLAAHAQPPAPAAPQAPVAPVVVPQAPVAAQPLYDMASADHSLHATALGKNAHLHLETGAAGPLSLHLTVQDGVADLEVEGPAAERLKMRPEELRRALAGEGLSLGHFASRVNEASDTRTHQDGGSAQNPGGQQQGSDDRARQADAAPRPTTAFTTQSGASSYGGEGRRHWQSEASDPAERDRRPGAAPSSGPSSSSSSDAPTGRRRGVHVTA